MNHFVNVRLKRVEELVAREEKDGKSQHVIQDMVAIAIVGLPYYWGEYSGVIIPYPSERGKVVAKVKNQKTGEVCHWKFSSMIVLKHLKKTKDFSTWKEYDMAQKLLFAKDYENLLITYNYSEEMILEKMNEYCNKFQIPYKNYLGEGMEEGLSRKVS